MSLRTFDSDSLVARFQADLVGADFSSVIRRHITTGEPVGLPPDVYFTLRAKIAEKFGVYPSSVVLVGSCKLGFSLKRKNGQRYYPLLPDADVDVAVVSPGLFDDYWDRVFAVVQDDRNWAKREGRRFTRDLFRGWLSPHTLPNLPRFDIARDWAEFFAQLTRERTCGLRTISARLYRTWDRLEAYQRVMVRACHRELEGKL